MSSDTSEKTIIQTITRIAESFTNNSMNSETFISVLSLLCLFSILNRSQQNSVQSVAPSSNHISLQKILGELTKTDSNGSPPPDILMTLLPLLNNPQLKSKINPSNIAAILGLINNLGGSSSEKQDSTKQEKVDKSDKKDGNTETTAEHPAAAVTTTAAADKNTSAPDETDNKPLGRYLNWKSNF